MKKTCLMTLLCAAVVVLASGCASSLKGDVYSREEARQTMNVRLATVLEVRPVVIEGDRNALGGVAGAVIGGVAGSAAGGGKGTQLATAVGAVAGAVIGQMTQEKMTRAQGVELVLQLDGGKTLSLVQEVDQLDRFKPGDRVRLIDSDGATRVTPVSPDSAPSK